MLGDLLPVLGAAAVAGLVVVRVHCTKVCVLTWVGSGNAQGRGEDARPCAISRRRVVSARRRLSSDPRAIHHIRSCSGTVPGGAGIQRDCPMFVICSVTCCRILHCQQAHLYCSARHDGSDHGIST